MKKLLSVFCLGLTLTSSVKADPKEAFDQDMKTWAKSYPILNELREEPLFKQKAASHFSNIGDKEINNEEVLLNLIRNVIKTYIDLMQYGFYFKLVEGLDPVTHDLLGTTGSPYRVERIFKATHARPEKK